MPTGLGLVDRRQFLARVGVLGAATTLGVSGVARAQAGPDPFEPLQPLLHNLARDTMNGLAAFVMPGPDKWSVAQGVTAPQPGGVDAAGGDFMMSALDAFYPLHDQALTPIVQSLVTGLTDGFGGQPLPLPPELLNLPLDLVNQLDRALAPLLNNDILVPLALPIALVLNSVATWVSPQSLVGAFPTSPFANLSWDDKAEAFRRMEEDTTTTLGALDRGLPQPLKQSLSGLVAFVANALLGFMAFGCYSEWSGVDQETGELVRAPVGWEQSGYLAETGFRPVEGWDEFRGYYAGRTAADPTQRSAG